MPSDATDLPSLAEAVGLRNALVHGYDRIEAAIVWETARNDLPTLASALREALARLP
jgi:uncharacterized protein with HEPN domain